MRAHRSTLLGLVVLPCALAFPAGAQATPGLAPSFDSPILTTGTAPQFIAHGNFDQAGATDMAVLDIVAKTVTIYRGRFSGSFTSEQTLTTGNSPQMIAVGDFDADGDPDLAVPNGSDGTVSIFVGDTGTAFTPGTPVTVGTFPRAVAIGTFDSDADPDLAVANKTSDNISIATGAAGATFNPATSIPLGTTIRPEAIATGNFNGDADPDLVTGNSGTDNLTVLTGSGSGATFSVATTLSTTHLDPVFVFAEDLNGDGDSDIEVGHAASNVLSTFVGGAGTTFAAPSSLTESSSAHGMDVADVDGDGDPELLWGNSASSADTLSVRRGTGALAATFGSRTLYSVPDVVAAMAGFTNAASSVPDGQVVVASTAGKLTTLDLGESHIALGSVTADNAEVGKVAATPQPVTYTNDGFDTVTPTAIVKSGNPDDFFVSSDTCTGIPLSVGQSCTVKLRFAPLATGTRTLTVSIRDDVTRFDALDTVTFSRTGLAATPGPAGPIGPTGSTGAAGPAGAGGATGPAGAAGTNGTNGTSGKDGTPGAAGAQGPAGAKGAPGRDAVVTCKPGKAKRGKVKVTCSVKLVRTAGAARVRARLTRGRTVLARGSATGSRPLRLEASRRVAAGRCVLTVVSVDKRGRTTISRGTVVVAQV
jgi:hypothetical protein